MAAAAAMMCMGAGSLLAQNDNNGGPGGPCGGGGGRGGRGGNFDPTQFRQQMIDRTKEMLEVKDDAEWKELQPRVEKVMDARRDASAGMVRGMMRGMRRRGGDQGGGNDTGGGNRPSMFGQSSPEADALQKAIDSKASKAEIKAALTKYLASRKTKEAELQQAQDKLRELLTPRQEAIATLNGLL